jgi:hypothetical protein
MRVCKPCAPVRERERERERKREGEREREREKEGERVSSWNTLSREY